MKTLTNNELLRITMLMVDPEIDTMDKSGSYFFHDYSGSYQIDFFFHVDGANRISRIRSFEFLFNESAVDLVPFQKELVETWLMALIGQEL